MLNAKLKVDKKVPVIRKTDVKATLERMPHGADFLLTSEDLDGTPDSTLFSAVSRLNKKAGCREFVVRRDEKDRKSFWVTRV